MLFTVLCVCSSFSSLLDMTGPTLRGAHDWEVLCWFPVHPERQTNPESPSANCIAAQRYVSDNGFGFTLSAMPEGVLRSVVRRRFYYILICGGSSRPVLTLRFGNRSCKMSAFNPSDRLRWLISFGSKAQARGDVVRG